MISLWTVMITCSCFAIINIQCAPIVPSIEVLAFMRKFGYIPADDDDSAALFTDYGLEQVIREIQRFGAIEQTGKVDNQTLALMKTPRCGVADIVRLKVRSKRFILGPSGWDKRNLTYFIANWSPKLSEALVDKFISRGLETWGRYGRLHFNRVYHSGADIVVAFGRGFHGDSYPFDGPGNILAHAFFPYEYEHLGGDIHFDDDENWTVDKASETGTNFYQVAVHELGHSLGLSHSPIPSSVMFPYYMGNGPKELDYDDILGMYELYIKHDLDDNVSYETTTDSVSSSTPTTLTSPVTISQTSTTPTFSDICEGEYDAIAALRNEIFVFKGEFLWRLRKEYNPVAGYPIPFRQMFAKLDEVVKRIDAAYQRPDGKIVLFAGKQYWVYDGAMFVEDSPRPLTQLGLPPSVERIDAVQNWARNGKTYLYVGYMFWRYNETSHQMDSNYPKHIGRWRGVPGDLDAATTWNGVTYFFKGRCRWKFDNDWIRITDTSPLPTPQTWFGCPKEEVEDCYPPHTTNTFLYS